MGLLWGHDRAAARSRVRRVGGVQPAENPRRVFSLCPWSFGAISGWTRVLEYGGKFST